MFFYMLILNVYFPYYSDGPGEKKLTSTEWSLLLGSFLTQTLAGSTGPSSGPWLVCTKRLTRACRNTCVLSPPCAGGCAAYHPRREVRSLLVCSQINTDTQSFLFLGAQAVLHFLPYCCCTILYGACFLLSQTRCNCTAGQLLMCCQDIVYNSLPHVICDDVFNIGSGLMFTFIASCKWFDSGARSNYLA